MSQPPFEIKLDDVNSVVNADPIWSLRGHAIQAYANLEQSLCLLFILAGSMANDVGGIIFFRITSTQVRNQILEKLIHQKFGTKYNLFWNSYLKQLRPIDIKRNEIVHWNLVTNIAINNGDAVIGAELCPPNFWVHDQNTPSLTVADLSAFMQKCDVFSRAINMFTLLESGHLRGESLQTWLEIFQQPLVYPLPEGHPLAPKQAAP